METPPLRVFQRENEEAIECWDDDGDLQCNDDIQFRAFSTATSVTGFSVQPSGHRDSISSRRSCKSDLDSNLGDDESWQLLLQDNDEYSMQDAIASAKNAGIPIPEDIPKSALLGGTIKRLGGKKVRKTVADDWSEDLDLKGVGEELELKLCRDPASPDALLHLSSLPTGSPVKRQDRDFILGFDSSPSPPKPIVDTLEKFRDKEGDEDPLFLDVPTIKVAKSRQSASPFVSHPPEPSAQDDFDKDFVLPPDGGPLRLATRTDVSRSPDPFADDFDTEWAEGSIGVRFGGTRRDELSNRSSTVSMISPSLSSCLTAESEEDALEGLVLPDGPLDLASSLQKKLQAMHAQEKEPAAPEPGTSSKTKQPDAESNEDFFSGIEIGDGEVFDPSKLTLNRNIKFKSARPSSPARRPSTAITFTNKPTHHTRIPRLSGHERPRSSTHLEPVSESGDPMSKFQRPSTRLTGHATYSSTSSIPVPLGSHTISGYSSRRTLNKEASRDGLRSETVTTNSQFLTTKRSTPTLRSVNHSSSVTPPLQRSPPRHENSFRSPYSTRPKTPVDRSVTDVRTSATRRIQVPFIPAGVSPSQSHHVNVKTPKHYRRTDSESSCEFQSSRSISRLSNPNLSPGTLAATAKHTLTKPTRRRNFGDGTELDIFDDLPTSAAVESNFTKAPVRRGAPLSYKHRRSQSNIVIHQKTEITAPHISPSSPPRRDFTPRFARDTNASRNAREQRLASLSFGQRDRETTPLAPLNSNWRNQTTPRPSTSPAMTRTRPRKGSKPQLIKPLGMGVHEPKSVKGMQYNPASYRWEGNEHATAAFDTPATPQALKPALIANVGGIGGAQIVGGMVFDPQRMTWLRLSSSQAGRNGVAVSSDEEDTFAGIEDLHDRPRRSTGHVRSASLGNDWSAGDSANNDDKSGDDSADEWPLTEEFDVGPEFIKRQRAEEEKWRRKVGKWVSEDRAKLGEGWRWAIRDLVRPDALFSAHPR
ncbi:hypothetical protein VTO42DRAFT_4653 [Malbranchea cinnamomea]